MPLRDIEKRKAYQQAYREAHKEKNKAYQQAYRKLHKKEIADYKIAHEKRVDIICIQCGKQATARTRNSGRFCSYNCFKKWQSGKNHPMYGKHHSSEARKKMSDSHQGPRPNRIGKHHSIATRIKLSNALSGNNAPGWRGGISFEPYCPKFNNGLKLRARAFFDFRCMICGKNEAVNGKCLSIHHVEYNKAACCDGKPVRFAALCHSCHSKTNHNRTRWEAMLHRCIDEIWGGRSYYTKEEYAEICKQPPDEDVRQ